MRTQKRYELAQPLSIASVHLELRLKPTNHVYEDSPCLLDIKQLQAALFDASLFDFMRQMDALKRPSIRWIAKLDAVVVTATLVAPRHDT